MIVEHGLTSGHVNSLLIGLRAVVLVAAGCLRSFDGQVDFGEGSISYKACGVSICEFRRLLSSGSRLRKVKNFSENGTLMTYLCEVAVERRFTMPR